MQRYNLSIRRHFQNSSLEVLKRHIFYNKLHIFNKNKHRSVFLLMDLLLSQMPRWYWQKLENVTTIFSCSINHMHLSMRCTWKQTNFITINAVMNGNDYWIFFRHYQVDTIVNFITNQRRRLFPFCKHSFDRVRLIFLLFFSAELQVLCKYYCELYYVLQIGLLFIVAFFHVALRHCTDVIGKTHFEYNYARLWLLDKILDYFFTIRDRH